MKKTIFALMSLMALTLLFSSVALHAASNTQAKPFLIQEGLPHLSMLVKMLWDDEDLALSVEQKEKLLAIRKKTMSGAKALGEKINPLEKKILQASFDGETADSLNGDVARLASLRAQATMMHLKCIYETRKILTKEQIEILE